jgi:hypothetical protein
VGEGNDALPSLADTIAAARRELAAAQEAGRGSWFSSGPGRVELESEVAVTRTGGGQAGEQLWVVTRGGKGKHAEDNPIELRRRFSWQIPAHS